MQYQSFDYLVALHHRLSPQNDLVELSWVIINTRIHTLSEVMISQIIPSLPSFQMNSFEHIISCLYQTITNIEKDLRSVTFVTFNRNLFQSILSLEASKRNIILPSLFNSFIPVNQNFKHCQTIVQFADSLGEKIQIFQHDIVILSKCCLTLMKQSFVFNNLVYVDRLNRLNSSKAEQQDYKFYKLRGLPFKVVNQDIVNFLQIQGLLEEDIEYQFQNHKFTGTVYVRVADQYSEQVEAKHEKHLGSRYVQINKASKLDFMKARNQNLEMKEKMHKRKNSRSRSRDRNQDKKPYSSRRKYSSSSSDSCKYSNDELNDMGIMKMRGLPFDVTPEQIFGFFQKYTPISHSLKVGYNGGRRSGDAAILFSTRKEAKEALELDREKIGARYIELITMSSDEYKRFK